MSFSSSFPHLDGVEFKISDSFQVEPPVGLPPGFKIQDPSNLLLESTYDFSKEHQALAWIQARRTSERKMAEQEEMRRQASIKRRTEAKEKQRELLKKQQEMFLEQKRKKLEIENKMAGVNEQSSSREPSESPSPPPIPPKTFLQNNTEILTPQPVADIKPEPTLPGLLPSSSSSSLSNQSQPVASSSNQIWVDFEDKELDPFTNMELKTIDDLKELESVLQNTTLSADLIQNKIVESHSEESSSTQNLYENFGQSNGEDSLPSGLSLNPFLSHNAQFSTELKLAVNEKTQSSSDGSKTPSPDINRNYENVKSLFTDPEVKGQIDSQVTPSGTDLYENVKVITMGEDKVRFEKDPIPIASPRTTPGSGLFSGVIDPIPGPPRHPNVIPKTDPLVTFNPKPPQEDNLSALYTPVRPRIRAVKSETNPVGTGLNQSKPEPASSRVLPVSFGGTPSPVILPPISSKSATSTYANITESELGNRPPIPPRKTRATPIPPSKTGVPSTANSQNGGIPHGATHLCPPYSLPVTNVNGSGATSPPTVVTPKLFPQKMSPPVARASSPDVSFLTKSQEERSKFEETMNKALSSLPKNPVLIKPVVAHKPTTPPFSAFTPLPATRPTKPPSPKSSLLDSVSAKEREFVTSIISMGFDLEMTIRAMKRYGNDAKEVVDHLCRVQRIADAGFEPRIVQDALDVNQHNDKQTIAFLQLYKQLTDMGFQDSDVKKALIDNKNDQTLALEQLMGQSG